MTGRPINQSREAAIVCGDKTYVGAVHEKCGTTERYVKNSGCVLCAKAAQRSLRLDRRDDLAALDNAGKSFGSAEEMDAYILADTFRLRFFCHPESSSVFMTNGEDPGTDGLVEEIDEDRYDALIAEGWTRPGDEPLTTPANVVDTADASATPDPEPSNPWD
jgi:hypothetical protein